MRKSCGIIVFETRKHLSCARLKHCSTRTRSRHSVDGAETTASVSPWPAWRRHLFVRQAAILEASEHVIQRDQPGEPADFCVEAVGPQQVAYPPARPDDTQRNAATC